jgi:hypothetical protein
VVDLLQRRRHIHRRAELIQWRAEFAEVVKAMRAEQGTSGTPMTADTALTPQTGAERPEKARDVPVAELLAPAYASGVKKADRRRLARQLRAITKALPGKSALADDLRRAAKHLDRQATR